LINLLKVLASNSGLKVQKLLWDGNCTFMRFLFLYD
jgi:hypothetical protein